MIVSDEGKAILDGIRRAVFISPHPDDVELCCGILITRFIQRGVSVGYVCVTDGAPTVNTLSATPRPARQGYDRNSYQCTRRTETQAALGLLGVLRSEIAFLDYPDLETVNHISELVADFATILSGADAVFCCPFEGGHPDHDICRFALAMATAAIQFPGLVFEYASYNNVGYQVFVEPIPPSFTLFATSEERHIKIKVANVFVSQGDEPHLFAVDHEVLRAADAVLEPVHFRHYRNTPFYERFAYGATIVLAAIRGYGERAKKGSVLRAGEDD
jgi:LmbE family N-acetylglucosaminyl deacetylase